MASYSSARALFDDIVRLARSHGRLIDDSPFLDAPIKLDAVRAGMLSIWAEDEEVDNPDYRVIFTVTTAVSTGLLQLPPALDVTDLQPAEAWDALGVI